MSEQAAEDASLNQFVAESARIVAFIDARVVDMREAQTAAEEALARADISGVSAAFERLGELGERIKRAINANPGGIDEALA